MRNGAADTHSPALVFPFRFPQVTFKASSLSSFYNPTEGQSHTEVKDIPAKCSTDLEQIVILHI